MLRSWGNTFKHNLEVIELNHSSTHQGFTESANNKYTNIYIRTSLRSLTFGVIFFFHLSPNATDFLQQAFQNSWQPGQQILLRQFFWEAEWWKYLTELHTRRKTALVVAGTVPVWPQCNLEATTRTSLSSKTQTWTPSLGMGNWNEAQDSKNFRGLFRTCLSLWIWLHMTSNAVTQKGRA